MPADRSPSDWFVDTSGNVRGPLTEAEMKDALSESPESAEVLVRQGDSDWYPADVIREKLDALKANGVFIRFKQVAEGPFTLQKAYRLLKTVDTEGIRVRTGTDGKWVSARRWIQAVEKVKDKKKQAALAAVARLSDSAGIDVGDLAVKTPSAANKPKPAKDSSQQVAGVVAAMQAAARATPDAQPIVAKDKATPAIVVPEVTPVVVEPVIVDPVSAERVVVEPVVVAEPVVVDTNVPPVPTVPAVPVPAAPVQAVSVTAAPVAAARAPVAHDLGDPLAGIPTHAELGRRPAHRHRPPTRRPNGRSRGGSNAKWLAIGGVCFAALLFAMVVGIIVLQARGRKAQQDYFAEQGITNPFDNAANAAGGFSVDASSSGPVVEAGMIFRPTFVTSDGVVDAGTAFAAQPKGSSDVYVISALHLFGPAGGLQKDIRPTDLPERWHGMALTDCQSKMPHQNVAMNPVKLDQALPLPNYSQHGDVAACRVRNLGTVGFRPFPIATRLPTPGERVWLVSQVIGSTSLVHAARVERNEQGFVIYVFDDPIELRATSGAPVVDRNGQVIAVNAGGGEEGGSVFGVGSPTARFVNELQ